MSIKQDNYEKIEKETLAEELQTEKPEIETKENYKKKKVYNKKYTNEN